MRKSLPKIGQRCSTPTGEGKVIGINILRRQVTLIVEGQRIEVGDRDLGTVVRWDTASKSGEPPPSISRVDAIAQGLVEATEEDLLAAARREAGEDWLDEGAAIEPGPGRGRLPGGGPRRVVPARPPRGEQQQQRPADRQQGGQRRGGGQQQQPRQRDQQVRREPRQGRGQRPPSTPANAGEGRVFRRGGGGPGDESAGTPRASEPGQGERPQRPQPADGSGEGQPQGQRSGRRRNRRGRGGGGGGQPPAAG
jgi:hypothetical protein